MPALSLHGTPSNRRWNDNEANVSKFSISSMSVFAELRACPQVQVVAYSRTTMKTPAPVLSIKVLALLRISPVCLKLDALQEALVIIAMFGHGTMIGGGVNGTASTVERPGLLDGVRVGNGWQWQPGRRHAF